MSSHPPEISVKLGNGIVTIELTVKRNPLATKATGAETLRQALQLLIHELQESEGSA